MDLMVYRSYSIREIKSQKTNSDHIEKLAEEHRSRITMDSILKYIHRHQDREDEDIEIDYSKESMKDFVVWVQKRMGDCI